MRSVFALLNCIPFAPSWAEIAAACYKLLTLLQQERRITLGPVHIASSISMIRRLKRGTTSCFAASAASPCPMSLITDVNLSHRGTTLSCIVG
jgi:hypothetical protein